MCHVVQTRLVRLISRENGGLWKLADIQKGISEKGLRWLGDRWLESCGTEVAEEIREELRDRGAALRSSQPNWEDELFKEPSTQSGLQRILLFSKVATVAATFQKSCHNLINLKRYHRKGGY